MIQCREHCFWLLHPQVAHQSRKTVEHPLCPQVHNIHVLWNIRKIRALGAGKHQVKIPTLF